MRIASDSTSRNSLIEQMENRLLFTTYYVDTNSSAASDYNAGTSLSAPLKTITQALNLVSADNKYAQSDTIYIRGGVYHEQPYVWASDSGASSTSRTVISAYVNPSTGQYEPVYIDAADKTTGTWTRNGTSNVWYLSNFYTMTAGVWVDFGTSNNDPSLQQIGGYNDGFPDQRTIVGSGVSSMTPGSYYGDLSTGRLYVYLPDGSSPNSHGIEFANRARAIYQPGSENGSGGYTWASNLDFVGLNLVHANVYNTVGQDNDCSIYTENNERLINCNIQNNTTTGVFLYGDSQMLNTNSSDNGRMGVETEGHGYLINGGSFDGNYWRNYLEGGEAAIKEISNDPTIYGDIENTEISGTFGKGIWYDTDWENSTVSHITGNYIHDNTGDGIDLEASQNFVLANNVVTNNQNDGLILNACSNALIYNNTFAGNEGISAVELDGGARMEGSVEVGTFNNVIDNNIIANNYSTYDLDVPTTAQPQWDNNNTSDYNLFYRSSGTLHFTDGGTYLAFNDQPTTLAGWQYYTKLDAHSVVANPGFLGGSGAAAYRIGASSPATGAGANFHSVITTDYADAPRPTYSPFDIGAFQATSSTNTVTKLTGTPIGTTSYWTPTGDTIAQVFDGNLNTYVDPLTDSLTNWVGLDLGTTRTITQIKYAPRSSYYAFRMVNAQFQVSNSSTFSSGVVTLATITTIPVAGQMTTINVNASGYRYIRYVGGTQWMNIAEMEVDGY